MCITPRIQGAVKRLMFRISFADADLVPDLNLSLHRTVAAMQFA